MPPSVQRQPPPGAQRNKEIEAFRSMFPTVRVAQTIGALEDEVTLDEIDLVLANNEDNSYVSVMKVRPHLIAFGRWSHLPGPSSEFDLRLEKKPARSEESTLCPQVPGPVVQARSALLTEHCTVKGWPAIKLELNLTPEQVAVRRLSGIQTEKCLEAAMESLENGTLIKAATPEAPVVVAFVRDSTNKGVAWIPCGTANRVPWVAALVSVWAEYDKEGLPGIADWHLREAWMSATERSGLKHLQGLQAEREAVLAQWDAKVHAAQKELDTARLQAGSNERRLLTASGDELAEAVGAALDTIGFEVDDIDSTIEEGQAKREDLRIREPSISGWEAIVEVKGYGRSGGKAIDLKKIERHARFYQQEKGGPPSKMIYIVNAQYALSPDQRRPVLDGAVEDIRDLSENGDLAIGTVDLFQLLRCVEEGTIEATEACRLVREQAGRFTLPPADGDDA